MERPSVGAAATERWSVAGTVLPSPVRTGVLPAGAGTSAVVRDLFATRTGRKYSRFSGPLVRGTTSAVAGLAVIRRLGLTPASFFRQT